MASMDYVAMTRSNVYRPLSHGIDSRLERDDTFRQPGHSRSYRLGLMDKRSGLRLDLRLLQQVLGRTKVKVS